MTIPSYTVLQNNENENIVLFSEVNPSRQGLMLRNGTMYVRLMKRAASNMNVAFDEYQGTHMLSQRSQQEHMQSVLNSIDTIF